MLSNRLFSNACLLLGIGLLGWCGFAGLQGTLVDPIAPAVAALCIGGTAILDRLQDRRTD